MKVTYICALSLALIGAFNELIGNPITSHVIYVMAIVYAVVWTKKDKS